jgi:4-amino-4-deoxy-L-arabinose transferase-like glycosyltransferase
VATTVRRTRAAGRAKRPRLSPRRLIGRVPRPLALLLVVVAVVGFTWAIVMPPWGAPDEDVHFAYTQTLAERHELPGGPQQGVSTEQRLSMDVNNTDQIVFFKFAKPDWSQTGERSWRAQTNSVPRNDGGGTNAASDYPPGYYLYELIPYELASSADIHTRLFVMRLFSVLWLLVSTVAGWLLAGEVFDRDRPLQLLSTAAFALWPMLTFISSAVNPDSMLVALWTLATWLGVKVIKRGLTARLAVGMCLCVGLALVTKATALALLPPALFALAIGAWRLRRQISARGVALAGAALAAFGVPVLAWVLVARGAGHASYGQAAIVTDGGSGSGAASGTTAAGVPTYTPSANIRYIASYLWQFYLPKLPFMRDQRSLFPIISHYPAYQVWLASGWATFGWVNVWFPAWVYRIFLGVALAIVGGASVTLVRGARAVRRGARRIPWALGGFFVITVGTLLAGLHWTDFHMLLDKKPPFVQGRYLLPVAALLALVVTQAVRALPRSFRTVAIACVLGGLIAFQIAALALVASRYYA